jgi:hypothetical protein
MPHQTLGMHPYNMMLAQELSERDWETRRTLCQEVQQHVLRAAAVLFSDEAHFHLCGTVNKQNFWYWAVYIKNAGMRIKEEIHKLLVQIWNEENMPATRKISIICPIHKKGDKTDCHNYRGVDLLNVTYKILTGIINGRIMQITEQRIGEYQCGFRRSRSTTDQIFVVRQIIEKHYEHGSDLHLLFIDYKSALDSVNRRKLVESMHRIGIPKKLVNLARMTLREMYAKVKIQNELGRAFKHNSGVKQGNGLSTALFNIILHTAIEKVDKRETIFTKLSQICAYAADVTILAKTETELNRIYQKLEEAVNELGLNTNETKTKYMSITNKQGRVHNNSTEIGSERFEINRKIQVFGNDN